MNEVDRLIERGQQLHARITFLLDQADAASAELARLCDEAENPA